MLRLHDSLVHVLFLQVLVVASFELQVCRLLLQVCFILIVLSSPFPLLVVVWLSFAATRALHPHCALIFTFASSCLIGLTWVLTFWKFFFYCVHCHRFLNIFFSPVVHCLSFRSLFREKLQLFHPLMIASLDKFCSLCLTGFTCLSKNCPRVICVSNLSKV
jgi:hypothetical protein